MDTTTNDLTNDLTSKTATSETASAAGAVGLWHTLAFRDAPAMTAWLRAVGFEEHATYRDEEDDAVVVHAEWLWPGGGGIMFGSVREGAAVDNPGGSAAYLVTADPDAFVERAVAAGGTVLLPVVEQPYGGRGGSVADPEGNHWSVGSYQPG
ncbi:VOC family protein [Nocardioides marmotae]|uniref:VOC family protein n=1 Tax=Nocardioides marmotae TaxID=2663857 RepID=UPI0012B565DC|nr:VOC family protein [Nocardioides marmotae]MBC9735453.1 glyoxalase [Nocardioides marmotae]MTB86550.1 glyoxalase [Nocardioides marmotae]